MRARPSVSAGQKNNKMSAVYNFKKIQVVPSSNDFIDIVLSKTQRKTPTVVHKHYQISRIRAFYLRKVKFTRDSFDEKLSHILTDFPMLDDIHPFYADLINVLYDRDHYKLALGQINTAKNLIDNVGRDYTRLLKYGDSLYRCKQLKKAALGRMATIMKRQKDTLAYLEQVRQHMARLPSIDPNTRTLLVCGYPNVGKSSFVNKLSRANVEVQPYAFTTKSLFVGHMDYKYLRWQVIDTPGILDHPLEERNTIEMLSITALAHLRACVLYFMDLTEQCGYSVVDQIKLFHNIKPLFSNKPLMLVVNKIDTRKLEDLSEEERSMIDELLQESNIELCEMSCHADLGVMEARNASCDKLLAQRVETKMKGAKVNNILHRIHVAQPMERDGKMRPPHIPEGILEKRSESAGDVVDTRKLEREIEAENGGAGVYNIDLKKKYMLLEDEWKHDIIPEIMDGHNVADFIDPEIEAKLEALEREEELLEQSGHYNDEMPELDENEVKTRELAKEIMKKKQLLRKASSEAKGKNRPTLIMKHRAKTRPMSDMSNSLGSLGIDTRMAEESIRSGRKRSRSDSVGAEDIIRETKRINTATVPGEFDSGVAVKTDRSVSGLKNMKQRTAVEQLKKLSQRQPNYHSKKGEADRVVLQSRPKHLYAGKRGMGSADHR